MDSIESIQTSSRRPLHGIFTAVPPRYDLVNRLMTLGLDQHWRRLAARECLSSSPRRVLDLCCGTGDLAVRLARLVPGDTELIGLDYSQPMLAIARKKAGLLASQKALSFVQGDAANLPFPEGYFDCVGISFAFRNLTYRNRWAERYLAEVLRVLRPGGRFIIVETSQPDAGVIRLLFHLYLRRLAGPLGRLLSGNSGAYRYLAESASHFYTAAEVRAMLSKAGFRTVSFRRLFLGAVAIHVAVR